MNIQDYISSGILESYAMGELSDQERADVEKNLLAYPELKRELTEIEEIQRELLVRTAIVPRRDLKNKILSKISSGERGKSGRTIPLSVWQFAAAASITIAVVATFFAFYFRSQWRESQTQLLTLAEQNRRVAEDYNNVNRSVEKLRTDLDIMTNPGFERVIMNGTASSPESMAMVYWSASTKEVYLRIGQMKQLASEKQYQLWAIIDGKPVDAGTFDSNVSGLIRMKPVQTGVLKFAVTIEPRGGKETPTLETLQVIGDVKKS